MKAQTDHAMPPAFLSSSGLHSAISRLAELVAEAGLVLELALCHGRVFGTIYLATGADAFRRQSPVPTACVNDLARLVAEALVREPTP